MPEQRTRVLIQEVNGCTMKAQFATISIENEKLQIVYKEQLLSKYVKNLSPERIISVDRTFSFRDLRATDVVSHIQKKLPKNQHYKIRQDAIH